MPPKAFSEVLERLRINRLEDSVQFAKAMAEQIEANRLAIEELRNIIERGWDRSEGDYLPDGTSGRYPS